LWTASDRDAISVVKEEQRATRSLLMAVRSEETVALTSSSEAWTPWIWTVVSSMLNLTASMSFVL
jgi:hypothetical protein